MRRIQLAAKGSKHPEQDNNGTRTHNVMEVFDCKLWKAKRDEILFA